MAVAAVESPVEYALTIARRTPNPKPTNQYEQQNPIETQVTLVTLTERQWQQVQRAIVVVLGPESEGG